MTATNNLNVILQLTDSVMTRACAVRLNHDDVSMPWESLLERYLKYPPFEELLQEQRITSDSSRILSAIQDLAYVSDDDGLLHDLFPGTIVKQGGRALATGTVPEVGLGRAGELEVAVIDLELDRWNVGYSRNLVGFKKRRWAKDEQAYREFIRSAVERDHGSSDADSILELDSAQDRLTLLRSLATRIWEADFESYSRFTGQRLIFKSGDETVQNMIAGGGGICSEKVQALKFLTDNLGYESEYLLAGPNARNPLPEERLRNLLATFEFDYSKRYMRYWEHLALLYHLDGSDIVVDATNGNIPLLFLAGAEVDKMLNRKEKTPVSVRMSLNEESFYYHRVSQDIPENLLFALEGWIPEVDLIQVFENELGLFISEGFFITPIVYKNQQEFLDLRKQYINACGKVGFDCAIAEEWDLESEIGQMFAKEHPFASRQIMECEEHLLFRYNESEGQDHKAGIVVVSLKQ
ncbi:MAG: hypothetical protein IH872_00880 [Chloroflexi bacterium]|nr:hypothetical protein [Chloroflexota bacterium]